MDFRKMVKTTELQPAVSKNKSFNRQYPPVFFGNFASENHSEKGEKG